MNPGLAFRRCFLVSAALILTTFSVHAAVGDCRRAKLDPAPRWMFHGEWVRGGEELILPDVVSERLLRIDRFGTPIRQRSSRFTTPVEIRKGEGGLILREGQGRMSGLRDDLGLDWEADLLNVAFPSGDRVASISSFIVADGAMLGNVLIVDEADRERWWGFGRLRLGSSPRVERLRALPPIKTPQGDLYFNHEGPFLAKAGGAVYAFLYQDTPHIERLLPSPRMLRTFPAGYSAPVLPRATGPDNTPAFYRAWHAASAPVALFGRGTFLYVLTRRPRSEGGTQWMLHQIDPAKDALRRSIVLPTRANDLVVIPGPLDWALVEKGPIALVKRLPEQVIGPVLFIPASLIEDPASPTDLSRCIR